MFCRRALKILLALVLIYITGTIAIPAAYAASTTIPINEEYNRAGSNIKVNLIAINITDRPYGNVFPSIAPEQTQWVKMLYTYENTGDKPEKGFLNLSFVGSDGVTYHPGELEYTGREVAPHDTSELRFIEIPMPKGIKVVKINITQGFEGATYDVPEYNVPTVVATGTVVASPATGNGEPTSCMPFLPFALIGLVACMGIVINRSGLKK